MARLKRGLRTHACNLSSAVSHYRTDRKVIRDTWFSRFTQTMRNYSTISYKHPLTNSLFRSTKQIIGEKRRHLESGFWYVIHPFSLFHFYWKVFMAFVYVAVVWADTFYEVIVTKCNENWVEYFLHVAKVLNSVYTIDILINFLTGYVESYAQPILFYISGVQTNKSKRIVLAPRKIACHYLRTFFVVDSVSVVNVFVFLCCTYQTHPSVWYNLTVVRLLRFARLYSSYQVAHVILSNPNNSDNIHAFIVFVCVTSFILSAYICAFLYLLVPDVMAFYKNIKFQRYMSLLESDPKNWQGYIPGNREIFFRAILKAYGILLGVNITGHYFSDCESTRFVLFLNSLAGYILRAFFIYTILVCLDSQYKSRVKYSTFMKGVRHLMSTKDENKQAGSHVVEYFKNTLKSEKFNEKEILSALEPRMRFEIFVRSSMDLVRTCHIFTNLPNNIVSALAFRLKYETYIPGIYVISLGEISNCMYFIATGTVAIYKEGTEVCHLRDGDYFGEVGLMSPSSRRIANVITIESSELYRLDIKDFHEVVKPNSLIYQRIRRMSVYRASLVRSSSGYDHSI